MLALIIIVSVCFLCGCNAVQQQKSILPGLAFLQGDSYFEENKSVFALPA
jgi:uncharacterized lipoprotein YajG